LVRPTAKKERPFGRPVYFALAFLYFFMLSATLRVGILHIARGLVYITLGLVGLAFALHFLVAADLAGTLY